MRFFDAFIKGTALVVIGASLMAVALHKPQPQHVVQVPVQLLEAM